MPTRRELMTQYLQSAERSTEELSDVLGAHARVILDDLEHVRRSTGARFHIRPAQCRGCGFVFRDRERLNRPSRCPECRRQKVIGPWFSVERDDD